MNWVVVGPPPCAGESCTWRQFGWCVFFQAEGGIRDWSVTGVQTCALPILGFRYSRNEEENLTGGVVSRAGLRAALLDTDPATAFNPFLGFQGKNTEAAISRVYVTLHATGQFELPLAYFHLDGDLFNLPAGPVSFAAGLEYHGERWRSDPDSENTSFDTIGSQDFQASKVNRDVWSSYQEVRIPIASPA